MAKTDATATTPPAAAVKHQTLITVSQEDIAAAKKGNSGHCMIADAIRRANGNAKNVSVDVQTVRWTDRRNGIRYVWLTPVTAQEALIKFDQGIAPSPFAFRLNSHPIAETLAGHPSPPGTGRPRKKPRQHVRVQRKGKGAIQVTTVGKRPPRIAALPGNRRRFGLKQLKIGMLDP